MVQDRYRELIGRGEASPSALIKALDEVMAGHPTVWPRLKRCSSVRESANVLEANQFF